MVPKMVNVIKARLTEEICRKPKEQQ